MKRVYGLLLAVSACLPLAGCGGDGENKNIMQDSKRTAIEEYEAAIAAEAAGMDAAMKQPEPTTGN